MNEERLKNIIEKEAILNEIEGFLQDFEKMLEKHKEIQSKMENLWAYYESEQWREDYDASGRGEIPRSIPHGVLSEDAVYNAMYNQRRLAIECIRQMTDVL